MCCSILTTTVNTKLSRYYVEVVRIITYNVHEIDKMKITQTKNKAVSIMNIIIIP